MITGRGTKVKSVLASNSKSGTQKTKLKISVNEKSLKDEVMKIP